MNKWRIVDTPPPPLKHVWKKYRDFPRGPYLGALRGGPRDAYDSPYILWLWEKHGGGIGQQLPCSTSTRPHAIWTTGLGCGTLELAEELYAANQRRRDGAMLADMIDPLDDLSNNKAERKR